MPWQTLGTPAPDQLAHTREQLHCVAQVVASVPRLMAPRADDWSHSAFDWNNDHQALISVLIPSDTPFRVGLRVGDATALFFDESGTEIRALQTNGVTIEALFTWLTRQIVDITSSALRKPLTEAEDGLPEPCVAGQTFDLANDAALAELARYYANSNEVLQQLGRAQESAPPVRTWPHHMDMAFSITLDEHADAEEARAVSLGMQPGDGSYAEPYYYSSPWPYPTPDAWPALEGGGRWHTEGFTAAVLLASDLVATGDAAAQQATLEAFARSAIAANTKLIGG